MSTTRIREQWVDSVCDWLRWFAERRLNCQAMDERRMLAPLPVLEFGNKGLMAMEVAEDCGGLGLDTTSALRVFEQLGAIDLTLATFLVNNNCLGIRPFERNAQTALKADVLPQLAAGREMISFALSEPAAGSNPMALQTTARRGASGYLISGRKLWIGNAAWANHLNVFCKLETEGRTSSDLTGFAVSHGSQGLNMGEELPTMGMRAMVQNAIRFDDVAVTEDEMLGRPGGGMAVANDAMMHTRLAFGAAFVGAMKRCVQIAAAYAARRRIATGVLLENGVSLERISSAIARIELLEPMLELLGAPDTEPWPDDLYVACKVAGSEFLWKVVDDAVQLCGGRGYVESNVLARFLRDARVGRIYEGPSETLLHYVGRRQLLGGKALAEVLARRLGASHWADLLSQVTERLLVRAEREETARDRAAHRMGQVLQWVLLLAVHEHVRQGDGGLARAWAGRQLDALLADVFTDQPMRVPPSSHVLATVEAFAARVGRLREQQVGLSSQPDPEMLA